MGVVKWGIINIYGRLPERDNKLGEGTNCNCCWLIKCVGECACVCVWLGHKQKPYVSRSTPARTHSQTELLTHPHQPPTLTPRHLSLTLAFVVKVSGCALSPSLPLSDCPAMYVCDILLHKKAKTKGTVRRCARVSEFTTKRKSSPPAYVYVFVADCACVC